MFGSETTVFSMGTNFCAVEGRLDLSVEKCRAPILYTDGGRLSVPPLPNRLRLESAGVKGRSVGRALTDLRASEIICALVLELGGS